MPTTIAMMARRPSGCRHPNVPPRTSSSKAATTQPALRASPTATGTRTMPGSGRANGRLPESSSTASHRNAATITPPRIAHPNRHPRPSSGAATTGRYSASASTVPRRLPRSNAASSSTELPRSPAGRAPTMAVQPPVADVRRDPRQVQRQPGERRDRPERRDPRGGCPVDAAEQRGHGDHERRDHEQDRERRLERDRDGGREGGAGRQADSAGASPPRRPPPDPTQCVRTRCRRSGASSRRAREERRSRRAAPIVRPRSSARGAARRRRRRARRSVRGWW